MINKIYLIIYLIFLIYEINFLNEIEKNKNIFLKFKNIFYNLIKYKIT